jgi:Flp pilus assembly secretin CpaC
MRVRSLFFVASTATVLFASGALAQEGGTIALGVGTQKVITVPGIQRVAIEDSAIADVKTIGGNQLLVIGNGPGKVALLIWKTNGQRFSYAVEVKGNIDDLAGAAVSGVHLERGEIVSYRAAGATRLELGDPSVVDAMLEGSRLKLRAKSPGRSDLVVYKGAAELAHLSVEVAGVKTASPALGLTAVELKVGASVTLSIDGLEKASAGDPKLVAAAVPRPGSLTLTAKAAGDATLELTVRGEPTRLLVKALP